MFWQKLLWLVGVGWGVDLTIVQCQAAPTVPPVIKMESKGALKHAREGSLNSVTGTVKPRNNSATRFFKFAIVLLAFYFCTTK